MDQFTVSSILNVIGEIFHREQTSIAVSNDRNFIYYQPSKKIDLKIKPGDNVEKDTVTFKALTVHQKISEYIDDNGYGMPYYGTSIPILRSGKLQGCITAISPTKPFLLTSFLTVKTTDEWTPIPFNQIMFMEAQNRKTHVHSERGSGSHKLNLSELELVLPNDFFIRVHRSYIVNINYILKILPDFHSTFLLIMKDQSKIQVSQTYASNFRKALGF